MGREIDKMREGVLNHMVLERPTLAKIIIDGKYLITTAGDIGKNSKRRGDGIITTPLGEIYIIFDFTKKQDDFPKLDGLIKYTHKIYKDLKGKNLPYLSA